MPALAETKTVPQDRVIRVFISSTFRDMQVERELLVKQVFPALRRVCAERFVTFTEVDLRWGITEEQQAEGRVLPICLEEIARSRPYFIGLLGERYGWIPDTVPPEVMAREPWLREHVGGRTSVTELEILHGVLNNPAMEEHAFFYFRDPAYVDTFPEEERREMTERDIPAEVVSLGEAEAARRTAERRNKLAALKERIRHSGKPVFEPYANPQALADAVRQQFLGLIDRLYPEQQVPAPLAREARGHAAYAAGKLLAYVERPTHTAALDAFVAAESTSQGLVLTGESGGGKTALLAAWTRHWRQTHPDEFTFEHYFGATPESATVPVYLSRLLGELRRRYTIADEIPSDLTKLREVLPLWLVQAAGRGRMVLVLDALNQIEGNEGDRHLAWLPRHFPPRVRVIASALPGPALDALQERGWKEYDLPLANAAERDSMVEAFLKLYGRTLREDLRRQLVTAPGAVNPLFLRTMLEELRQFGSFERLPAEVARYLEATTLEALFRLVIRRWRHDFDGGRDLVRHTLRHLWAARHGLGETEWLELLDRDAALPRQTWAPLFYAIEPHLAHRAGSFTFGHDFLRQAVRAEFLSDDADVRAAHRVLADYFDRQPQTLHNATELPWQLREAGERDRLRACILDIDRCLLILERDEDELLNYWVWLGEERGMGRSYLEGFELWSQRPDRHDHRISYAATQLATLLYLASLHTEAEPLMRRALAIDEQCYGANHPRIARDLNDLAQLLTDTNRFAEAEPLMRRALAIDERMLGAHHKFVAIRLNNLATLLKATNRLSEAESLMRRALAIDEDTYGDTHPAVARDLNNLAQLLQATNRLDEAESSMRRALAVWSQAKGESHPNVADALNNLAALLQATNRPAEAEPLMRRALAINEHSFGRDHPNVAINLDNLAELLRVTNRLAEAEPLMRRAIAIFEQSRGNSHPQLATALNNLAVLLEDTNRLAEAEPLIRRALSIDEHSFGTSHPRIAGSLNNLATLLYTTDRLVEAEPLMRRALAVMEQSLGKDHPRVASILNNLAHLLQATNRFAEAEPLMRRALAINEQTFGYDHPDVAKSLNNLAALLHATNRLAEAEPLARRALAIDEDSYGKSHPAVAEDLNNLAQLLQATNRLTEAEPLMRRALVIDEQSFGHDHPGVAGRLNNLAALFRTTNRFPEAEQLMRRALAIDEESYGKDHTAVAKDLYNLAQVLEACNRLVEAEPLIRRALTIWERSLGGTHPNVAFALNDLALLLEATNRVAEAEPLMRRAITILEDSLGDTHPYVATALNSLAQLLQATNRLAEAEPLMRRHLEIFLSSTRATGFPHPHLQDAVNNYTMMLDAMGRSREQILATLSALAPELFFQR